MSPDPIALINDRDPETNKTHYGHALLIAGSYSRMGCALLAAKATLRSGVGLLTTHLPRRCVDPMQTGVPEAMVSIDRSAVRFSAPPRHLERYNAIAIGPGIGTHPRTVRALRATLAAMNPERQTLILDADALNIIALHPSMLAILPPNTIVTPHAGEYQRLFGNADAAETAVRNRLVIVQKSHRTKIHTPEGTTYTNSTGNAGMATAGSGDVLTGIILGLAAQGLPPAQAAKIGVLMHGKSGDNATQKQTQASLIASDLVENLRYTTLNQSDF
ncbi:MAG: NAD(P)H-hydrate dehydratase [Bacteroidales bacterium]|nr:NAD(P)H-hydrate dehydratase [Bacteroidales bacterium]